MSKYEEIKCPFCGRIIPFEYEIVFKEVRKRKRRKPKMKKRKIIVGIKLEEHKRHCKEYQEYINLT